MQKKQERFTPTSFLPDGSLIMTRWQAGESDLVRLAVDGSDGTPTTLLEDARSGLASPDGRWLLYRSTTSGRSEAYIRRIRDDGSLGNEIPISKGGAAVAFWYTADGTSPLVIRYGSQLKAYRVTVAGEGDPRISEPEFITDVSELWPKLKGSVGIHPDGRFLVFLQGEDEEVPTEINVVLNWFDELDARLRSAQ